MSPFVRVLFACLTTVLLSCYLPPLPNNRPDPPVITGPSEGFVDSTYTFTLLGRDPDSNNIRLRVSWGDGDTSQWTPFIHSGETTQVTHSWTEPGTYTLRAQAMDWKDSVSEWSKGRVVSVYPLLPLRVVDSIPLPISPDYLVLSPDGERLYAVREGGDVCVLRTADGVPVGSLQLRDLSGIPVISPAGRCIYYASEEDYVYAVSAEDYTVIDSAYGQ